MKESFVEDVYRTMYFSILKERVYLSACLSVYKHNQHNHWSFQSISQHVSSKTIGPPATPARAIDNSIILNVKEDIRVN